MRAYVVAMIACACSAPAAEPRPVPIVEPPHEEAEPASARSCGVAQLALGDTHVCALLEDGSVYCAGLASWGQLGDGLRNPRSHLAVVEGARGAEEIVAGMPRTCVRMADASWRCWGRNLEMRDRVAFWDQPPSSGPQRRPWRPDGEEQELSEILAPAPVPAMNGMRGVAIGDGHQCGLVSGEVTCWGANGWGQLGNSNTRVITGTPARVAGVAHAVELALGMYTTCARLEDGTVSCWGKYQHLAADAPSTRFAPEPIAGLTEIVDIAIGSAHACALSRDGRVRCWGNNVSGGLGDGTLEARADPVFVNGVRGATEIAVGMGHTCALLRDGTVQCWGYNANGQLGDGTREDRVAPVRAQGIDDAVSLHARGTRTCVVRRDRTAACFGRDGDEHVLVPTALELPCR